MGISMSSKQRKQALKKLYQYNELSAKEASKKLGVSARTVRKARRIELQNGDSSLQRILEV